MAQQWMKTIFNASEHIQATKPSDLNNEKYTFFNQT